MGKRLVYGKGINDAGYVIEKHKYCLVNGEIKRKFWWACPYYSRWKGVLARSYSLKTQEKNPTYKDCSVSEEWLTFSNFRVWIEEEDTQFNLLNTGFAFNKLQLDKDLLFAGNKLYSSRTCAMVHSVVNSFAGDCGAIRGKDLVGFTQSGSGKVISRCRNPFTKKKEYLGTFSCGKEAHLAWKKRKHELSVELANSEYVWDERVRQRLLVMYK